MFRRSDNSALIYSTDDLVLFRESPFAAWMERLTLENPDHGIIPDTESLQSVSHTKSLADIAETLRLEGRNVVVIPEDIEAQERAISTEAAMRGGADFIVNAYLTEGSLAVTAGLIMRTSGFSDLGDYLYIPCEARPLDLRHSSFRLCVLADLLQIAQGQLPPQMLIISGGADLTPLQTEDHIYYYRSVKARFLQGMAEFRKHRMPDPADSTFFGRWSACAGEVLKQRAQRDQAHEQEQALEQEQAQLEEPVIIEEIVVELPKVQAGGGPLQSFYTSEQNTTRAEVSPRIEEAAVPTLAEQASMLAPGSFSAGSAPGHTPNLARIAPLRAVVSGPETGTGANVDEATQSKEEAAQSQEETAEAFADAAEVETAASIVADVPDDAPTRRTSDIALENLEFIGSAPASLMGPEPLIDVTAAASLHRVNAPDATLGLRESFAPESPWPEPDQGDTKLRAALPDLEPPEPALLPPESLPVDEAAELPRKLHPMGSPPPVPAGSPMIDMDGAPPASLSPVAVGRESTHRNGETRSRPFEPSERSALSAEDFTRRQFSNSLQTGNEFEDSDEP